MIWKLLPLLFLLVRLAFNTSLADGFLHRPKLLTTTELREKYFQQIQYDGFAKMYSYTKASWDETAPDSQNYHIFPLVLTMRTSFAYMGVFYGMELYRYYYNDEDRDKFLGRPYELARIFDEMQNTSDVELKFPNAYFYDRSLRKRRMLDDISRHFHTEIYRISTDPQDDQLSTDTINDWTYRVTNGRQPKIQSYKDLIYNQRYVGNFVIFTGCWESTKTRIISSALGKRNKRFIPAMSKKTKTFKQEGSKEGIEIHWFSGRDLMGYYEDVERKFTAISIPFKGKKFAMAVMLPYYNQSLEIFRDCEYADYRQILQRVNETYRHVDYTIPVMDSQTILINSNGVGINGGELCHRAKFPEQRSTKNLDHRLFIVDRPFGLILYHKPTSLVLMHALVRNPLSRLWPTIKYYFP